MVSEKQPSVQAASLGRRATRHQRRPAAKALPLDARKHNRSLVLQTLFDGSRVSRADLSRSTGLTRVTISDLIADLIDDGLVRETGMSEDVRPGKKATLLEFDQSARQVVALDLSGAHGLRGALLDLGGHIVAQAELPRAARGEADTLHQVIELARSLTRQATRPILGVGIGSPGIVAPNGVVLSAPNLGWHELKLASEVAEALDGLPVLVANDANAAALAEHSFGDASGDLIVVRIGHGVGAGLLVGGTTIFGSHFAAGEIGHVVVGTDGGRPCACGKSGCLETWLSIPHLTALLADRGPAHRGAVLHEAGRRLGVALAPVIGALDLTEIVLSGPPDLLAGDLAEATTHTLRERTMSDFHGHVTVRMSELGDDIVVLGAAAMVMSGELGIS